MPPETGLQTPDTVKKAAGHWKTQHDQLKGGKGGKRRCEGSGPERWSSGVYQVNANMNAQVCTGAWRLVLGTLSSKFWVPCLVVLVYVKYINLD